MISSPLREKNLEFWGLGTKNSLKFLHVSHTEVVFPVAFFFSLFFWLCWVFIAARGLLIVVASLASEHGL